MTQLRIGIIGQGRSGRNIHAEYLKTVPEKFKIVAVSDYLADRCQRARDEYGCEAYQDYREMINNKDLKLDLVVNSTFSDLHAPISKEIMEAGLNVLSEKIMEAGLNVLSEKPFAQTADQVKELIGVSKRTGRLLAVFQQSRFAPYYRQIQKVILSGVLGDIKLVKVAFNGFARRYDWQTLQCHNAGGLYNTGPHPLDQVLGFIGRDIMPNVQDGHRLHARRRGGFLQADPLLSGPPHHRSRSLLQHELLPLYLFDLRHLRQPHGQHDAY